MIRVDGSVGEGGGQMLRTSIALSCLTEKPVELTNIRIKRDKPGLRPQHAAAVNCMKKIFNAETNDVEIGSKKLFFKPNNVKPGQYNFDIETAGSITLVFQTIILGLLNSKQKIKINLKGGSDVRWSPPWDYFENVFIPFISNMGINIETKLINRGYYPKGNGEAEITINPIKKIYGLKLDNDTYNTNINGVLHISRLPDDINKRIKHSAIKTLFKENLEANIRTDRTESDSEGVGLTLWNTIEEKKYLGSAVIGEKGLPSEILGSKCASMILKEMNCGSTVDIHLFDQILPFIFYARSVDEKSCLFCKKISSHAETNLWVLKKFFDFDVSVFKKMDCYKIEI